MTDSPTISALYKAKAVSSEAIDAAVEAYLADPDVALVDLGDGRAVDVEAAVRAHEPTVLAMKEPETPETAKFRRGMVRTAILLARAEKG